MTASADDQLADALAGFYADPLGYVMFAFPWDSNPEIQQVELPEKYRERFDCKFGPDLWACEFLEQWGQQIEARGFDGRNAVDPIQFAVASGHGIGKEQAYSVELDTPDGRKKWADVRVGDRLFGVDGRPVRVVARHEQGVKPMYRICFNDGTSTLAGAEHVWRVKGRQERRNTRDFVNVTTLQLLERGVRRSNGKVKARQFEIPTYGAIEYPEVFQWIDPYILGLWIGDGTKGNGQITSADAEIWQQIAQAGYDVGADRAGHDNKAETRTLFGLQVQLREIGMMKASTATVRVPENYRYASVPQRLAMLQGLLDTDGWVEKSGTIMFGSISQGLARDVLWLARSLGMIGRELTVKKPWFTYKGERRSGQLFWRVSITWDGSTEMFRLPRKQEKLTPPEARYLTRWIDRIEEAEPEQAMCVTVDAADGLYLTNDFIVTHNSALSAWIVKFIADTRPFCKGTVTAGTDTQLRTKTWAELGKWHRMSLTSHWFDWSTGRGAMSLKHKKFPESWFVTAQTCREENSEAFAGQHAANSTSFYLFDEASAVPDKIYEVRDGGLTDGEPMTFDMGNPTKNSGRFYDEIEGKLKHRHIHRAIDSRTVAITNKPFLQRMIDDYGEDSDIVRVRVRGMFPKAGSTQFIPGDIVEEAGKRDTLLDRGQALVIGVDVARFGDDETVIWPRIGKDARSFEPRRYSKLDTNQVVGRVIAVVNEFRTLGLEYSALFIDQGYNPGVVDNLRNLGYHVIGVNFGGKPTNPKYRFKVDEMWGRMKNSLMADLAIPPRNTKVGDDLYTQLTQREFGYTVAGDKINLESKDDMKKRLGIDGSPDLADALALTFSEDVAPRSIMAMAKPMSAKSEYDPLESNW